MPLAPPLSEDDRRVVEAVAKVANFLAGGSVGRALGGGADLATLRQLAPLVPGVATEVVPELSRRLAGRIAARVLRDLFL